MALVRWNPWGEVLSLHDQMDQLFQQALAGDTMRSNAGGEYANLPVDIRQADDRFVIEASVPGFKPEDVELTFDDGVLTIRGLVKAEGQSADGAYVRRERRQSSFFRQVTLPNDVRADDITASFEHGVLTVSVPRAAKAQPKRIPVSAGRPSEPKVIEAKA